MTTDNLIEVLPEVFDHFNINLASGHISLSSFYKCVCHDVFQIRAQRKTYFLKRLNPIMLQDPAELMYHNKSQEIALFNYNKGVDTVLAYRDSSNEAVYPLRGNFYMLYPWIDTKKKNITHYSPNNYYQIGALLGRIHKNFESIQSRYIFRKPYYDTLENDDFRMAFHGNELIKIMEIYRRAVDAFSHSENNVLSHCDITPNNLLWKNDKVIIVDWDAAGWTNQEREIQQTIFSFLKEDVVGKQLEVVKCILMGYLSIRKYRCSDFDKAFFSSLLEDFESIKYCTTEKYGTCFYSKKHIRAVTKDLLHHLSVYGIIKEAFSELSII